jgi:hypothetical protein
MGHDRARSGHGLGQRAERHWQNQGAESVGVGIAATEIALRAAEHLALGHGEEWHADRWARVRRSLQDALGALRRAEAGICVTIGAGERGGADRADG